MVESLLYYIKYLCPINLFLICVHDAHNIGTIILIIIHYNIHLY